MDQEDKTGSESSDERPASRFTIYDMCPPADARRPFRELPRLQLTLHRGDLDHAASLLGEPAVRRTAWFYLSSVATHLDGLAALRERNRLESEAPRFAEGSAYLEPFALRALAIVREDDALLSQTAERFTALGLDWHAARTRDAAL